MKVYMKVVRPVTLSDVKRKGQEAELELKVLGFSLGAIGSRTSKSICGRMLRRELPGRRLRRRPKAGCMDEVRSRKRRGCRRCALASHR